MRILQIVAAALIGIAVITTTAHALEFPGKRRLPRETYLAVQHIYYPGFTIAGFAEPAAVVAMLIWVLVTPHESAAFWPVLVALLAMAAMHAVFWIITQPANRYWMGDRRGELGAPAERFFALDNVREADWRTVRARWEYSHLVRATLSVTGLVAVLVAIAVGMRDA